MKSEEFSPGVASKPEIIWRATEGICLGLFAFTVLLPFLLITTNMEAVVGTLGSLSPQDPIEEISRFDTENTQHTSYFCP